MLTHQDFYMTHTELMQSKSIVDLLEMPRCRFQEEKTMIDSKGTDLQLLVDEQVLLYFLIWIDKMSQTPLLLPVTHILKSSLKHFLSPT